MEETIPASEQEKGRVLPSPYQSSAPALLNEVMTKYSDERSRLLIVYSAFKLF